MSDAIFRLRDFGQDLLTRDRAAPLRAQLAQKLDSLPAGAILVVDMDGVGAITPSFTDELLGRLLLTIGKKRFRAAIRLQTTDETTRLLVNRVLIQRASELGALST